MGSPDPALWSRDSGGDGGSGRRLNHPAPALLDQRRATTTPPILNCDDANLSNRAVRLSCTAACVIEGGTAWFVRRKSLGHRVLARSRRLSVNAFEVRVFDLIRDDRAVRGDNCDHG